MADLKPRIYWAYYPKSRRGYWRVSMMDHYPTSTLLERKRWRFAHRMVRQMNEQDHDRDCEIAVST